MVLALKFAPPRISLGKLARTSIAIEALWGFAAFMLLLWIVAGSPAAAAVDAVVLLFCAASVEEIVFRVFLPSQLAQRLLHYDFSKRDALIAGCVVSQCAFALCHFAVEHGYFTEIPVREFGRLFAAGLLYAEIVALMGVGTASAIHACMNFSLHSLTPSPMPVGLPIVSLFVLLGLVLLWFRVDRESASCARSQSLLL